ncbi:hypothetical protein [Rothia nasisuis]|uniref:hypothetical protein n=1 Tax=Rothia nasisuis TaxID=2109647 RepID=UPI001F24192D|nr:hypothetical protein [Rothia nasisuis]
MDEAEETPQLHNEAPAKKTERGKLPTWMKSPAKTVLGITVGSLAILSVSLISINASVQIGDTTEIHNNFGSAVASSSQTSLQSKSVSTEEAKLSMDTGTCLLSGTPVPCDTEHDQEVISTDIGTCDISTLYAYVSGNPDFDYFGPSVSVSSSGSHCIAHFPSRQSSVEGAWANPAAEIDPLRACFAGPQAISPIVDCSQPHTGEIVYQQDTTTTASMDCQARAEEYTNTPYFDWRDTLRVDQLNDDSKGVRQCILTIRGDGELKTGLRNLKNTKVHVAPSS